MPSGYIHVCLDLVPPQELSVKRREFEAQGWIWVDYSSAQVVLVSKDFASPRSEATLENEIKEIMGDQYVDLTAPGSTRREPELGEEVDSDVRDRQRAGSNVELKSLPERHDSFGNLHGGAQVAQPIDPPTDSS